MGKSKKLAGLVAIATSLMAGSVSAGAKFEDGEVKRESEVLYWATLGKTDKIIGEILGTSPRTVNKHMEHVLVKLDVESRTAAATLVTNTIK